MLDSEHFGDGESCGVPRVEIPATFFTADQRRRIEHELRLLHQASTEEIAITADGWLKKMEVARSSPHP